MAGRSMPRPYAKSPTATPLAPPFPFALTRYAQTTLVSRPSGA